jgi:hypothetical protein
MKVLLVWLFFMPGTLAAQTFNLRQIRALNHQAPENKRSASDLNKMVMQIDSVTAAPVLVCYKGANEMIQAKYSLNPINKLEKFNKGKVLIEKAFGRDSLNLEIRFIRFAIQRNLPSFLRYHDELERDKQFLLINTRYSNDPELKEMILNYLETKN